ncbi:MAG: 3-oxoacyl-[acyl-carrier-protein] reductase [Candidatus Omnitrophota bacterium]
MSLKGNVAIVTGGSRGIGLAIAKRLGQEGALLSLCSRHEEVLVRVQEEMEKKGISCFVTKADVSDPAQVKVMVEKTLDKFGKIDILVNNAGITDVELLVRTQDSDWQRVLDVNLTGAFLMTRAVAKEMIKARYGRIVNISSVVGLRGSPGQSAYAASKAGLLGLTKSVARELAPRGITCNAIAPGFIETDMTCSLPEATRKWIFTQIPLDRFGSVEEVAELVQFLVSDDAGYLTGQVIRIDGGIVTT